MEHSIQYGRNIKDNTKTHKIEHRNDRNDNKKLCLSCFLYKIYNGQIFANIYCANFNTQSQRVIELSRTVDVCLFVC